MGINATEQITNGQTFLGIEFGSTRIKAVLIGDDFSVIASGSHTWENHLTDGIWTYPLDEIHEGFRSCYSSLKKDVRDRYGAELRKLAGIGVSGMMHGYMPFDDKDNLLVPFRTWRNTITAEAADMLTKLFNYNIPQRWSIAHLCQAILNKESHIGNISFITTLAGYIHYRLTGKKAVGVGEASGMFPIDPATQDYDKSMESDFNKFLKKNGISKNLREILPIALPAGADAGRLTPEGAAFIDPDGDLEPGIPLCPPEGDAGTGMTATNSVAVRTANVSAGTSIFAMVVLEEKLKKVYREIDLVTTPAGDLVGMVHCNNCTSDLNAWIGILKESLGVFGSEVDSDTLYTKLFEYALRGDSDCGGVVSYNYYSGEGVTDLNEGRPLLAREQNARFSLANLMRANLYSCVATLKLGCDIMLKDEGVSVDKVLGHGGLFKTKGVGQSILAAALNAPVSVMETAGEGGAWGMALLAAYSEFSDKLSLSEFLDKKVFANMKATTLSPDPEDVSGFNAYIEKFRSALAVEKAAISALK
ncbi:MAG: FGGY-family carbohydrate kinase [Lachnospiraceae bacterium]|nr:FGGY-family carbohydrate kinase [Lachnospiraceae bacterium]